MNKEAVEFDVLGTRVKFTHQNNERVSSDKIVNLVLGRMNHFRKTHSHLADKDIAVLTALEFAQKSLELAEDFKLNLESLESSINQALEHIEQPSKKIQ